MMMMWYVCVVVRRGYYCRQRVQGAHDDDSGDTCVSSETGVITSSSACAGCT